MRSFLSKLTYFINTKIFSKYFINKVFSNLTPICRIEEINLEKKIIIIYCRGISSPIKLSLDEVIYDSMILSNLTPKQASWIGYYYGRYYKNSDSDKKSYNTFFGFSIDEKSDSFKIKMLDRQGNIIYSHDDNLYIIQPIKALNDQLIINNFTPIQACYIGILAGASIKRTNRNLNNSSSKVNLKIIK